MTAPLLCPECAQGRTVNCAGQALDPVTDELVACATTTPSPEVEPTPRPWPENAWPTAAELADWLSRCTSAERLSYADLSIATAQRAVACVEQDHEGAHEKGWCPSQRCPGRPAAGRVPSR